MPLTKEEILALSNALVRAVREYVPYSSNMKLWAGYEGTEFFNRAAKANIQYLRKGREVYFQDNQPYFDEKRARRAISSKTGFCGELASTAITLLKLTPIKNADGTYAEVLNTDSYFEGLHSFILIHNGNLPDIKIEDHGLGLHHYKKVFGGDFNEFADLHKGIGAVICDPWINCSVMVDDYGTLLGIAEDYGHKSTYIGGVFSKYTVPLISKTSEILLSGPHNNKKKKYSKIFHNMQNIFFSFYEEEKLRNQSFKRSRSEEELRLSKMKKHWESQIPRLQLISFVQELKKSTSIWYKPASGNKLGISLQGIITYCSKHELVDENLIKYLFISAIEIAFIPQYKDISKLSQLPQTAPGKKAFSLLKEERFWKIRSYLPRIPENYKQFVELFSIGNLSPGKIDKSGYYKKVLEKNIEAHKENALYCPLCNSSETEPRGMNRYCRSCHRLFSQKET